MVEWNVGKTQCVSMGGHAYVHKKKKLSKIF